MENPEGFASNSQLAATLQDVSEDLREQRDALRRALEIIAVGDAQNPQAQAAEELIALGYWRDTPDARIPAGEGLREQRDALRRALFDLWSAGRPAAADMEEVELAAWCAAGELLSADATERGRRKAIFTDVRESAEAHKGRGDDCGRLARMVLAALDGST